MNIRFVTNEPILYLEESKRDLPRAEACGKWLCITDVHIGITQELAKAGITLPDQINRFVKKIEETRQKTKAKNLLLLGDVKHNVIGINFAEVREIPDFLEQLSKRFEKIVIVKGNHDGNIERLIPDCLSGKVIVQDDFIIHNVLFTHGHRKLPAEETLHDIESIIIGHNQPAVLFQDGMGAKYVEPCWVCGPLKGKFRKYNLIIMPAFNSARGHALVNKDKLIGPVAKNLNRRASCIYMLDGTSIGSISGLKTRI